MNSQEDKDMRTDKSHADSEIGKFSTTDNQNETNHTERSNTTFHHVRYVIIILSGLAIGCMFFTRLSITVAILAMVNHTHLYLAEHPNSTVEDYFKPDYVEVGQFNWSNEVQQTIITGYMVAYTLPQVMTTKLTMIYGIRKSLTLSLLVCAISCLLTPMVSYWGWQWNLGLRLLNGFGASSILPSLIGSIEAWMPSKDSAMGLSLLQFVETIIYILIPLISGELAYIHWEWAFYGPAITTSVFALIWWIVVRDTPDSCPFISQKEINFINGVQTIGHQSKDHIPNEPAKKTSRRDVPWYIVFRVKSFYLFIIVWILYCGSYGGLYFLLPTYFHKVLRISVDENGFYNFVIHLAVIFSMLWANPIIAYLQKRFKMSLTSARRIITLIFTIMTVASLGYIAAFHENQILVISVNRFFHMTADTIVTATLMSQYGQEGLTSLAFSVMNTFGNLSSVFFCWAVGRFLDYTGESLECWSWVFVMMCGMNILLFLIYTFSLNSKPIQLKDDDKSSTNNKLELKV